MFEKLIEINSCKIIDIQLKKLHKIKIRHQHAMIGHISLGDMTFKQDSLGRFVCSS